jgi:hypothetical protein
MLFGKSKKRTSCAASPMPNVAADDWSPEK